MKGPRAERAEGQKRRGLEKKRAKRAEGWADQIDETKSN